MSLRKLLILWTMLFTSSCTVVVAQHNEPKANGKGSRLFQVSLLNKYHRHYCGGAIIRSDWILTAGRCSLVCGEGLNCAVRYGSMDINSGRFAPIRIFAVHPTTNIAIVEAPLILQGDVKPIMIFTYPIPLKAVLMAVGWRWDRSPRTCNMRLKKAAFHRINCFMNDSICALPREKRLCYNEYGGSLVYQNQLVGISNFGLIDVMENETSGENDTDINYISHFILRSPHNGLSSSGNKKMEMIPDGFRTKRHNNEIDKSSVRRIASIRATKYCSTGYGTFVHVARFTSWIDQTIRQYIEDYDLDNLPRPSEWTQEYVRQTYVFEGSTNKC